MSAALNIIQDHDAVVAILHPIRRKILEALQEPMSAASVGRIIELPRQKVNYHLRELEKTGLVKLVEERIVGNCQERIVVASASSYLIDPAALGRLGGDPTKVRDRFSLAYLIALFARAIRDLAWLRRKSEEAGQRVATFSMSGTVNLKSAKDRTAWANELANAVAQINRKFHHEDAKGGRSFDVILGILPTITKRDDYGNPLPDPISQNNK